VSEEGPYAGGELIEDEVFQLRSAKALLKHQAKLKRDAVRDGGLTTTFGAVDTDLVSRVNISGAVQMASIAGEAFSQEWRMADDAIVTLDAEDMIALGVAVGQFVAECQTRKNVLDALVDAAEDLAGLEAIDVQAGWPS
jgi:hypothetical protein